MSESGRFDRPAPTRPAGRAVVPAGWPDAVQAPHTPGWERSAAQWLLDLCPAEYRGYPALRRHVMALVHVASHHVEADLGAIRSARASARAALGPWLDPPVVDEVLLTLDGEEVRLIAARRAVGLIAETLRGGRHVAKL